MKLSLKFVILIAPFITLSSAFGAAGSYDGTAADKVVRPGPIPWPESNPAASKGAGAQDPVYVKNTTKVTAPRQMEKLGRGVVVLNQGEGKVWVSWRMLGTEPDGIAFNIYRSTDGGPKIKLNKEPITDVTFYQDADVDTTKANAYFIRPVINGKEGEESKPFLNQLAANAPTREYIDIPIKTPPGFTINDCSVGDLDGDGEYEVIVHLEANGKDNTGQGYTGEPVLQAYKMDGTMLWQINLGKNIREGAHYTQFMVADFEGTGCAEVICKTAPGTIDGTNNWALIPGDDPTKDYRNAQGYVEDGPEYLTVFDGKTGKALDTVTYVPDRGDGRAWGGWGGNGGNDGGTNRRERFLACVAYLDGIHPSAVFSRGYYGRTVLAAWDVKNGKLSQRWVFDSVNGDSPYSGQGAHGISVADVDGDGRDEIIFCSMVIDDNGKALFSTGLRHGDALHVGKFIPDRPGLQVFGPHENDGAPVQPFRDPGAAMYDARTGEVIWYWGPSVDVGRGVCADIDPRHPGAECWWAGSGGLYSAQGEYLGPAPRAVNFICYWDGSLLSNILDSNHISRWDYENGQEVTLLTAQDCTSNNSTKSTPCLSADLFGDWREEVIWRTRDNQHLRIYSSEMPTKYRMYTLMHDPQYRDAIAWQNVAYNQPPHVSFDLVALNGHPPKPNIVLVEPKPAK